MENNKKNLEANWALHVAVCFLVLLVAGTFSQEILTTVSTLLALMVLAGIFYLLMGSSRKPDVVVVKKVWYR